MRHLDNPQMWLELAQTSNAQLLVRADKLGPKPAPAAVMALRRDHSPELVAAAIELVAARRAAAGRIDSARSLLADVAGVQQATSSAVARHKACRIRSSGVTAMLDLCCGIGGDAIEFAASGIDVTGIDMSPARCVMAQHNAGVHTVCDDVERTDVRNTCVHVDPSRRDERSGRRMHQLDDYQPGRTFIERVIDQTTAAAIKLGPGINVDEIPRATPGELEFISENRSLVQAMLWTGGFAQSGEDRRATMLPGDVTLKGVPRPPDVWPDETCPAFLFDPDPAVERAQLVYLLCRDHDLSELWPGLGMLAGSTDPASPWLSTFRVVADMPWRERTVRNWLRDHGAGIVEVKTRGKAVDPTPLQSKLRGSGDEPFSVLIYRLGKHVHAYCCRRAELRDSDLPKPEHRQPMT